MMAANEAKNITGTIENKKGYVPGGYLIGNSNTGKLHSPGCRAIGMMKNTHKVPTDGAHFKPCKWCYATGSATYETLDKFNSSRDEPDDIEICYDKKVARIFLGVDCDCGSHDGVIKMRLHDGGFKLLNREGKWWIWRECYSCGHQLSLVHLLQKRKVMKEAGEI